MRDQEILGLMEAYSSIYTPQEELTEEVQIAAQYFYEMGLNEEGIDILIEELGVEEFAEFVYDIAEEYVLTEARAGGAKIEVKTAKGKEIKGKPTAASLKRLRAQKAARKSGEEEASDAKPSGMKASLQRQSAVAAAAKKQPKKPGLLDRVAGAVNRGIERHNAAMASAKKTGEDIRKAATETGKTVSKAAKHVGGVAKEVGKGASGAVKFAAALAKEEVEAWVNSLLEEGYDLSDYTWDDMCEIYTEISEGRTTSLSALSRESDRRRNPQGAYDTDRRLAMRSQRPSAFKFKKDPETGRWSNEGRRDTKTTEAEVRTKVSQRALRKRDKVPQKNGRPMFESSSDMFDYILEHLVAEGYADTNKAALAIMANMSEEWRESIVEELISEGEKPFPHEKVERKQKSLRDKGGDALERRMRMGAARRRAKEAERTGGSQQDAGAGWYHGR